MRMGVFEQWKQQQKESKMKNKQKTVQILYQGYRQFIQFINDLSFPAVLYICIMCLPTFTIFGDLLAHVPSTHFLNNLSGISIASLIVTYTNQMGWLLSVIKVFIMLLLVLPVILVLFVVLLAVSKISEEQVEIGYFYQVYNSSSICRMVRLHINLFERVLLPIIVSLCIKIILSDTDVCAIIMVLLTFTNSTIFQYYSLQISSSKFQESQQKNINFPNILIETILVMTSIILVNVQQDLVAYIGCVCLYFVRVVTSFLFRFYSPAKGFYHHYRFMLLCSTCFALALLIGFVGGQQSIMLICACLAVCILARVKGVQSSNSKNSHKQSYTELLSSTDSQQVSLTDVKKDLKSQKIAKTFKEAVWISRGKHSHRDELTIDIIKSKCYREECQSRGSTKMANTLLLLDYEVRIVDIIKKTLVVQEKAVEALTIMKSKEPKQEMLVKTVVQLVNLINENKRIFIQCIKINALAKQLTVLMHLFFKQLYNDSLFLREIKSQYRNETQQTQYKRIQKQLFSEDAALIVINIIDEVGKITKVSNNMPNVLGYPAHTLIGLSVNELIPLSIRQIHDSIINNFVNNFTSDVMRQRPSVEFYGHDNMFHLQKVEVRYKFFLHKFQNLELSSILRKQKTEDYVILTDEFGNIEGWTQQLGELFNLDELSGNDCSAYNIVPLIPAYAKYQNRQPMCLRTVAFRPSKTKNPKLILFDFKKQKPQVDQIKKKQIQTFLNLLEKGDMIQAYYVSLEIEVKIMEKYGKAVKIIKFMDIKRLENFDKLQNSILDGTESKKDDDNTEKFDFDPGLELQGSIDEEDAEFSMLKLDQKQSSSVDLNFSLDPKAKNTLQLSDLKFYKDIQRLQTLFSTRSLLKLDKQQQSSDLTKINENLNIESNFNPKLERGNNMIWLVIVITIVVLSLIIEDQVSLGKIYQELNLNKTQMYRTNRAEMIYCKSIFNPNQTYISEFDGGNLLMQSRWLLQNNNTYISYNGDTLVQNQYYLLNVQIPATLDRVLNSHDVYQQELFGNFYNMVGLYEKTYQKYKQVWSIQVEYAKTQCQYKMIAFSGGAIVYLISLIFIQRSYKNQRKTMEAFFKFQRSDLNQRINSIKAITNILEKRCAEWFIDEYLNQIKKGKPINKKETQGDTFSEIKKQQFRGSNLSKASGEVGLRKAQMQQSDQIEVQIEKKRFNTIVALIVVVLFTQILFLILHGVLTSNMLNTYKDIINKFDQASKLAVYPNLKMASIYQAVPVEILTKYEQSVQATLDQPIDYMPSLYDLLSEKPCESCPFMSEILNTNYRSFYSYFGQTVNMNLTSASFRQLYYAVDVVVEKITGSLQTKPISNPRAVVIIYVFSVVVFFASVILILNKLESEYTKLETFLKFFNVEVLLKNKHMSTVMSKNM